MQEPPERFFEIDQFVPSLREKVEAAKFDLDKMILLAIPIEEPHEDAEPVLSAFDRRRLYLQCGDEICEWETDSLRELFRGDRQPPVIGDYPEAYNEVLLLLDMHALEIGRMAGDPRDSEMKEIYSTLRRRPDGRSLGPIHDYMWQAAALMLATRPLSQMEFEAIIGRLERSCRTFEMGPTSRNYIQTLRRTIGQEQEEDSLSE